MLQLTHWGAGVLTNIEAVDQWSDSPRLTPVVMVSYAVCNDEGGDGGGGGGEWRDVFLRWVEGASKPLVLHYSGAEIRELARNLRSSSAALPADALDTVVQCGVAATRRTTTRREGGASWAQKRAPTSAGTESKPAAETMATPRRRASSSCSNAVRSMNSGSPQTSSTLKAAGNEGVSASRGRTA